MATWYAIHRISDGELLGCGTVLPDTLPEGSATIAYQDRPDQGNRWDPATLTWVAIPPEPMFDRLQDMAQHPYLSDVWSRLTAAQRTKLRRAMVWLLGGKRYRQPTEEVAIDVDPDWPTDPANATE